MMSLEDFMREIDQLNNLELRDLIIRAVEIGNERKIAFYIPGVGFLESDDRSALPEPNSGRPVSEQLVSDLWDEMSPEEGEECLRVIKENLEDFDLEAGPVIRQWERRVDLRAQRLERNGNPLGGQLVRDYLRVMLRMSPLPEPRLDLVPEPKPENGRMNFEDLISEIGDLTYLELKIISTKVLDELEGRMTEIGHPLFSDLQDASVMADAIERSVKARTIPTAEEVA